MSRKSSSRKNIKGGGWKGELVFEPGISTSFYLTQGSLIEEMSEFNGIDEFEELEKIWLYKRPLKKGQLTQFILNHQFVVIRSKHWYWSIEKHCDKILLQRNKSCIMVREYEEGILRNTPVVEIKHGGSKGSMQDLIKFLYRKDELKKAYHWMEDNCKDLANRVFNEFVVEGSVGRSWHIW